VTDVPTTHGKLIGAGYDVTYGRRLFFDDHESIITDDPDELAERDYYTVAYAERPDTGEEPATAAFGSETSADGGTVAEQVAAAESGGDGEAYRGGGDE
jgi:precorrin-2/cobalt-factor-2 C20-methyltransferase